MKIGFLNEQFFVWGHDLLISHSDFVVIFLKALPSHSNSPCLHLNLPCLCSNCLLAFIYCYLHPFFCSSFSSSPRTHVVCRAMWHVCSQIFALLSTMLKNAGCSADQWNDDDDDDDDDDAGAFYLQLRVSCSGGYSTLRTFGIKGQWMYIQYQSPYFFFSIRRTSIHIHTLMEEAAMQGVNLFIGV